MLQSKSFDEHVRLLFKQSKSSGKNCAPGGQEAVEVGVALDLRAEDSIVPPQREFLANLDFIASITNGVSVSEMISLLYARSTASGRSSSSAPRDGYAALNLLAPSATIAAQSIDVARANKRKKKGNIMVAFLGDAPKSLDLWQEALHIAGAKQLPILFVLESYPLANAASVKPKRKVADLSGEVKNSKVKKIELEDYGFPVIPVDGDDAVAVYRVAFEAIKRARQAGGPTLMDCKSNRESGINAAVHGDPILLMEQYLTRKGIFTEEWKQSVVDNFQAELDEAVKFAEGAAITKRRRR